MNQARRKVGSLPDLLFSSVVMLPQAIQAAAVCQGYSHHNNLFRNAAADIYLLQDGLASAMRFA
jgi:hypothetical protein